MLAFLQQNGWSLLAKASEHLMISLSSLSLGILIALPIGIALVNTKKLAQITISICSVFQTVPSLALLAIMVPFFGVGKIPAILALFIYSLLPILRNTYLGMQSVDQNLLDAAKGMGMTRFQVIRKVQLPLAMSVIMSGIRLSAVYVIGWATIAAYIGAGGLGDFIFAGLNNFNLSFIFAGSILVTMMALIVDLLLGKVEKLLLPKNTSQNKEVHHEKA